ncbi:peptidase U32 family protein, partial [Massilia sp. CT11-108]|uniref:peptidase U32 family protein n=1 Tax=Massilia sp. CT11-108 TaxID=3393900 RepID=UPI0039A6A82F
MTSPSLELVCPAGSLPALKAAIDHGADCVYLGFRDATNARNFAGLNFSEGAISEGIRYAHDRNRKVFLALNTYPQPGGDGPVGGPPRPPPPPPPPPRRPAPPPRGGEHAAPAAPPRGG